MNSFLRFFAVITLLATALSSSAADSFQGKVTQTATDEKGRAHDINYSIKGQKVRIDLSNEGQQVAMITDLDKLEVLMIMSEQKMYMVMPFKKPLEDAVAKSGDDSVDIQVTGKTETILGYKCNQLLITDKKSKNVTETWLAEGLGVFTGLGSSGGPFGGKKAASAAKWEEALKGKTGFPLRVIGRDAKGKTTFKLETTKLDPSSLPDSLFIPPAGYNKFQMPSMGDLLKGLGQ